MNIEVGVHGHGRSSKYKNELCYVVSDKESHTLLDTTATTATDDRACINE